MITVFTPTYNRALLLPKLYDSLKKQSRKSFEWLVVDDGSVDKTRFLIEKWNEENPFEIRYVYQDNGGKHRAINRGAQEANGEWFFFVDSDDYLPEDAIEVVEKRLKTIESDDSFLGISCLRADSNGTVKSPVFAEDFFDQYRHLIDARVDFADVWRTSILRNYPFPDIPGEKFCAESLIILRISQKYRMRFFKDVIYICDYLPGGLTDLSIKNRRNSPGYTILTNLEILKYSGLINRKMRAAVNFWRFVWFKNMNMNDFKNLPCYAYLFLLFGLLLCAYDSAKLKSSNEASNP